MSNVINAKDLRIGNLVDHFSGIREVIGTQVDSIHFMPVEGKYDGDILDNIQGIPLTEDWLKKFGFEKMAYCYKISIGDGFLAIEPEFYSSDICDNEENYNVGKYTCLNGKVTKHVHQLQNLFFALTGEELKIKDL